MVACGLGASIGCERAALKLGLEARCCVPVL
jgi:hypothetical protein